MAGVNNVSTYDNAPENSNNTLLEHTNKADDSDDEDSLQNVIDNELSRRLDECEAPANRVKYSVDIMLTAESIHSASAKESDNVEYSDLRPLKPNEYQVQKDTSEQFLLTEKQHCTEDVTGLSSEIVFELSPNKSDIDNDGPLSSDNMSSGFEDGVTRELSDLQDPPCAELDEPRIFTRPLPVDESDNVTELVFDTWTTVEDVTPEIQKIEVNGDYEEKSTLDISTATSKQECFDINTPAITNSVTEVVSETTTERKTVKKKSLASGEQTTTVVKTKKTKKSKKSDEKENISVNLNGHSINDTTCSQYDDCTVEEDDLSNVCVRDLKKSYCDGANRKPSSVVPEEPVPASIPIDELKRNFVGAIKKQPSGCENGMINGCSKSSFGKFDQLEKKSVLQQRSLESEKSDTKQNGVSRPEVNSVCKSCEKTVYAMEQIKAERQVWHKNCFRCTTCNKQLTLDIYSSHEGILYCKPHFKELFKPKVVVEDEEPIRRKKPEMIIRENQPMELPPDVVRASDKPDLGLEELSSLNVKSRFQAFENVTTNGNSHMEKSPVSVKRSPSILSKLAKFQSKGMDVGVANDALNGAFFEPSSSSESEDEDAGNDMLKNSISKEKPMSFDKMESVKRNWEMRREEMKEEHKQEIQNIRSKLFAGKQGKMKQMYEQAVAESERIGVKRDLSINKSDKAKVIKEKFEKGEIVNNEGEDVDEINSSVSVTNGEEDEMSVFEAGISKKSRSLFMELDANAVKTKQTVPVVNTKKEYIPTKQVRPIYNRQVSDDVVKCSDRIEDVSVETAEVSSKFKFFETYKPPEVTKKQFRITPPREGQIKGESPERDIYRDPNVVRSEDPVDETAELVKSNTTAKMLSLFRQMEVARPSVPDGPKPLKCFTPPPDYKESESESESDDDEVSGDDDSEDDESINSDSNGDVVKSSMKVEDEFLKNAQNAVMARSLKEKFEHWEPDKHSLNNAVTMLDSEQESIESTKSLRARFESLKGDRPADKPKPKVNRFLVNNSESIKYSL
ncbi:Zinc finger, LIM-type [Cinara cedri]|uniref:Zinc finger, LIM-type n=1 Tax=Cinara cedri TaxID=506608 RepID=A0A5E4NMC6_9HEMI|nr:Zinc finger, LIM-type [Cinara cedri]